MDDDSRRTGESGILGKIVVPVAICIATGAFSFALGTVRAESERAAQIQDLRSDIQKLRAMPDPHQVVTKDQLTEIVYRLDEPPRRSAMTCSTSASGKRGANADGRRSQGD